MSGQGIIIRCKVSPSGYELHLPAVFLPPPSTTKNHRIVVVSDSERYNIKHTHIHQNRYIIDKNLCHQIRKVPKPGLQKKKYNTNPHYVTQREQPAAHLFDDYMYLLSTTTQTPRTSQLDTAFLFFLLLITPASFSLAAATLSADRDFACATDWKVVMRRLVCVVVLQSYMQEKDHNPVYLSYGGHTSPHVVHFSIHATYFLLRWNLFRRNISRLMNGFESC